MSVFICWSGDRSHELARAVETLLTSTLKTLRKSDVFVSDDIEKGASWFDSIEMQLGAAKAGIVCLTAENLDSPWLHFEAGALAQGLATKPPSKKAPDPSRDDERPAVPPRQAIQPRHRLFTLLHCVTGAELRGPLATYQATSTTNSEVTAMIRSVASVLGEPHATEVDRRQPLIDDGDWKTFEVAIAKMAVPARKLISDLESHFQRKTFNEPLQRCADQAWLRRYDGARLTRERLADHLERVRTACSTHESSIFEMLLNELDGYAMALQALLLTPKTFPLGEGGELTMPDGIQTSCEQRRLAIRSLASLLLRPTDEPLCSDAVRFMGADTNEERKMIVHRMEGEIRRKREVAFEREDSGHDITASSYAPIKTLTQNRRPILFRESAWDLDRIYYYLLIQYFGIAALRWEASQDSATPAAGGSTQDAPVAMRHDWLCAARDVEMEVERYRARSKGGSLMPLTYALVALQEIDKQEPPNRDEAGAAVESALGLVKSELGESALSSEAAVPIARVLHEIASSAAARSSASKIDHARP